MKKNINKYISCLVFVLAFTSCKKDFLNVIPQGRQVATTVDDYSQLINSKDFYVNDFAGGWQGQVLMGDDVAAESDYFNTAMPVSQKAFTWADDIFQAGDIDWTMQLWLANMYTVNKVINEVMQSTGSDQQKKIVLAEAQATRAWLNFQFVNFYGKPYVASTAATDLAFPIITTADVSVKKFTRGSVQAVYDVIISDFTSAITNLPVQAANARHFSKAAAEGLLGKVYLYMGKNSEASTLFNAAFTDVAATNAARLYDYNAEFAPGGKFDPVTDNGSSNSPGLDYNDVTESIIARSFYNTSFQGNGYGNDFIVLSAKAAALFKSSDLRLNFYAAQFPYNTPNPSGRLSKIAVQYSKFGLQLSELYLLSAECKARLNDLSGAVTDVETLRKARMPVADATVPAATAANQNELIKFIFDERTREFAAEGYRWFDMRRQSVDPVFAGQTFTHTLYNNQDGTTTIYTLNPVRLTMRLPYFITVNNPDIPNNL